MIDVFRRQLRALHRRMRREQPSVEGLSTTAYEVLIAIDVADGPQQPSALGAELQMTSPNVAAALRTLERLDLIVRTQDRDDKRKAYVAITDEGRAVISEARRGWRAWLRDAIDGNLTKEEQRLLFRAGDLMQRLADDGGPGRTNGSVRPRVTGTRYSRAGKSSAGRR